MLRAMIVLWSAAVVVASPSFGGINRPMIPEMQLHKTQPTQPQLQPANYKNFERGLVHFFEHEILYVENDLVLIWKPTTGEWRLHRVNRACGVDCPIIADAPEKQGVWEDRKMNKFVFLGCHATTGHGHMMQVHPLSGNYSIVSFDHSQSDPILGQLAYHRRIEATQFSITYLGKDEIMMYDGSTYKVYLVEPRLPMYSDEDPIGPYEPLAEGKALIHEQLVYLGNDHLADYSPLSGDLIIYRYDRSATLNESPLKDIIAQIKITRNLVLTYIGENQLIGYDPSTGKFHAFQLLNDLSGLLDTKKTKEGPFYGFGSVLDGNICSSSGNCRECVSKNGCGWCETTGTCLRGSLLGPCMTNCTTWDLRVCPGEPCHMHSGCSMCLLDPFCGWCSDTMRCTEGTHAGPLFGSCDFSKVSCPVYVKAEAAVAECHEEIE